MGVGFLHNDKIGFLLFSLSRPLTLLRRRAQEEGPHQMGPLLLDFPGSRTLRKYISILYELLSLRFSVIVAQNRLTPLPIASDQSKFIWGSAKKKCVPLSSISSVSQCNYLWTNCCRHRNTRPSLVVLSQMSIIVSWGRATSTKTHLTRFGERVISQKKNWGISRCWLAKMTNIYCTMINKTLLNLNWLGHLCWRSCTSKIFWNVFIPLCKNHAVSDYVNASPRDSVTKKTLSLPELSP